MNSRLTIVLLALICLPGCSPEYSVRPGSPANSTTTAAPAETPDDDAPPTDAPAAQKAAANSGSEQQANSSGSSDKIERITFDDLNCGIQANIVFREWMLTPRAKELDGQRVRLAGYMLVDDSQRKNIEEFVLLKNTECKFGPDGQADHLALIKFGNDNTADYTTRPIDVIGTLRFNPFQGPDGFTWAIYEIEAEKTQPMRR